MHSYTSTRVLPAIRGATARQPAAVVSATGSSAAFHGNAFVPWRANERTSQATRRYDAAMLYVRCWD